jgi:hypothetical protein
MDQIYIILGILINLIQLLGKIIQIEILKMGEVILIILVIILVSLIFLMEI